MKTQHNSVSEIISSSSPVAGEWKFKEITSGIVRDLSIKGNDLETNGAPRCKQIDNIDAVMLDGISQSLGTKKAVVRTSESYSVAAWLRLDSDKMGGKLQLIEGEHALTAVSQDSPTHSGFYLGVRKITEKNSDGSSVVGLKWNFTVSPIDGSQTGPLEWLHVHSKATLSDADLDKWIFLVGVCNVKERHGSIFIPSIDEQNVGYVPDAWTFWSAEGGLQIGRGLWLGRKVDYWPGSIGPVRMFSGVLTKEDARRIYFEDLRTMQLKQALV